MVARSLVQSRRLRLSVDTIMLNAQGDSPYIHHCYNNMTAVLLQVETSRTEQTSYYYCMRPFTNTITTLTSTGVRTIRGTRRSIGFRDFLTAQKITRRTLKVVLVQFPPLPPFLWPHAVHPLVCENTPPGCCASSGGAINTLTVLTPTSCGTVRCGTVWEAGVVCIHQLLFFFHGPAEQRTGPGRPGPAREILPARPVRVSDIPTRPGSPARKNPWLLYRYSVKLSREKVFPTVAPRVRQQARAQRSVARQHIQWSSAYRTKL